MKRHSFVSSKLNNAKKFNNDKFSYSISNNSNNNNDINKVLKTMSNISSKSFLSYDKYQIKDKLVPLEE